MRKLEVARHRAVMGRRKLGLRECAAIGACMFVVTVLGCGDATCPGGSKSVDGQCVPAAQCDDGFERVGNVCMRESGVSRDGGVSQGDGPARPSNTPDAGAINRPKDAGSKDASATEPSTDSGAIMDASTGSDPDPVDSGSDSTVEPDPEPGPCADYVCGDHGECEIDGEQPRCACDTGYAGERCESCATGLGLADGECVPACDADDAPKCGEHGACEVTDNGDARCACVHPAAGELCDACAEGFAMQQDGSCAPDCGDCGAHGFCDGTLLVPECACYAGYENGGSGCVWVGDGRTGGIVGGDFTTPAAWQATNAEIADRVATFQPVGSGVNCDLGALSQTLRMPSREQSEPLALELDTSTTCTDEDPENCPPLLVEMGASLTRVRVVAGAENAPVTQVLCLGDAGYGESVTLRIRPGVARIGIQQVPGAGAASWPGGFGCGHSWPTLHGVRIRADAACGHGDGVEDSEFNAPAKWSSSNGATVSGGTLSLPVDGAAAAPFLFDERADVPHPALSISLRGTSPAAKLEVKLDGLPLTSLPAPLSQDMTMTTRYVCLPDWSRGVAHSLELRAGAGSVEVGSVTVKNQILCEGGEFDRGFEHPLATGSWFIHPFAIADSARPVSIPYEGSFSVSTTSSVLAATMLIPSSQGGGHARISGAAQTNASSGFVVTGSVAFQGTHPAPMATLSVQSLSGWPTVSICPGPIWDGQPIFVVASVRAALPSGATGTPVVRLDDFGASSSTDCPGP